METKEKRHPYQECLSKSGNDNMPTSLSIITQNRELSNTFNDLLNQTPQQKISKWGSNRFLASFIERAKRLTNQVANVYEYNMLVGQTHYTELKSFVGVKV